MTEFERRLAGLTPAAVDRDAVLFAAGRASAPSPRWWRRTCSLLLAAQAVTLGLLLTGRPGSPPAPPSPVTPTPSSPADPPTSPPDPSSYLVLLRSWDDPRPPAAPGGSADPRPPLTAGCRDF
jgi:hypothetical protein